MMSEGTGPRFAAEDLPDPEQDCAAHNEHGGVGQEVLPLQVDVDRLAVAGAEVAHRLRGHDRQAAGSGGERYSPRVRADAASPILERARPDRLAAFVDGERGGRIGPRTAVRAARGIDEVATQVQLHVACPYANRRPKRCADLELAGLVRRDGDPVGVADARAVDVRVAALDVNADDSVSPRGKSNGLFGLWEFKRRAALLLEG